MSSLEASSKNGIYLKIVQGTLRQDVHEGTKDAIRREWEAAGRKGVKHELVYKSIIGKITGVSFYDGEYEGKKFQSINITLDENEEGKNPVISTGVETRYGQDLMKKLPSIDFDEEVKIMPYSFVPDGEEKEKTGVSILQRDGIGQWNTKIKNFFWDEKTEKSTNDFPEPEGKQDYDSDDWKMYYTRVKKFLVNYTKANVCTKFQPKEQNPFDEVAESPIDPASIPF